MMFASCVVGASQTAQVHVALRLVTSLMLELSNVSCVNESEVAHVSIPDDVRELRGGCFADLSSLPGVANLF